MYIVDSSNAQLVMIFVKKKKKKKKKKGYNTSQFLNFQLMSDFSLNNFK